MAKFHEATDGAITKTISKKGKGDVEVQCRVHYHKIIYSLGCN